MQEMPFEETFEKLEYTVDGLKRLAKIIGVAAMATLLQGCPEKNPKEATLQSSVSSQVSDVMRGGHVYAENCEKGGGLIACEDEKGFMVVTSSGD